MYGTRYAEKKCIMLNAKCKIMMKIAPMQYLHRCNWDGKHVVIMYDYVFCIYFAQPVVQATAFFQPEIRDARSSWLIFGSKLRSTAQFLRISSSPAQ